MSRRCILCIIFFFSYRGSPRFFSSTTSILPDSSLPGLFVSVYEKQLPVLRPWGSTRKSFFRCFSLYILHDDSFIRATRFWFSILRLSSNYLSTSPSYFIISHSIHSLAYAHSLIHSLIHSFIQSIITFFPCTSPWLSDSLYVRSRDMKIRCNDSIRIDYFLFFFRFISPIYSSTHPLFIHFHYFCLQLFFALSRPLD